MRIFKIIFVLWINLLLAGYSLPASAAGSVTLYSAPNAAQQHCPTDEVVWLNTKSGIWHAEGGRWFGNTKHGAYVCKKEAATSGNRASLNG